MAANNSKTISLSKNRKCTVSEKALEVQIDAKATFILASNYQYRKLLDSLTAGDVIECKTESGFNFQLQT